MLSNFDLKSPILMSLEICDENSDHRRTPVLLMKEAAMCVFVRGGLNADADLVLCAWKSRFSE